MNATETKKLRESRPGLLSLTARALSPQPRTELNANEIRQILVYADMGIGNMLLFIPTLQAIRKKFPQSKIVLFSGNSGVRDIAERFGYVDSVVSLPSSYFGKAIFLIRRIFSVRPQLLVSNFLGNNRLLRLHTAMSRIPYRVGHVSGGDWTSDYDFLYNLAVPMKAATHEAKRNLLLAKELGCEELVEEVKFRLSTKEKEFVNQWLSENNISSEQKLVAIQPGASVGQEWKCWPEERFAQVADQIQSQQGYRVVFLGASSDGPRVKRVLRHMKSAAINVCGNTSLGETAAIISKAAIFLGNDSGLMHVASALGVQAVGIYGPTDERRTAPLGIGHSIVRGSSGPTYTMRELGSPVKPDPEIIKEVTVSDVSRVLWSKLRLG